MTTPNKIAQYLSKQPLKSYRDWDELQRISEGVMRIMGDARSESIVRKPL